MAAQDNQSFKALDSVSRAHVAKAVQASKPTQLAALKLFAFRYQRPTPEHQPGAKLKYRPVAADGRWKGESGDVTVLAHLRSDKSGVRFGHVLGFHLYRIARGQQVVEAWDVELGSDAETGLPNGPFFRPPR